MKKIYTNQEIVEKLISISGSKSAADLARELGTERQNIKSFENKETLDLNNKMLSFLIHKFFSKNKWSIGARLL